MDIENWLSDIKSLYSKMKENQSHEIKKLELLNSKVPGGDSN
ncbi:hypothetical protein PDPUS_2_01112 [Photobacterium damselae subsp. piscicida]|uniref:Uncharacterized protein n=1 Tax=Photobacterium damsela subsp. piscicida TaxID=38294 RepID=A0AAD1FQ81_PHODP|nr:hypothetical protein [Photobacterium damselae]MDP2545141.1 hypothetical protein [Photobacterium damselae subsp. piscicida]BAX55698.1 hypothetical protein PDPUS_2_01112 [Photobacterium damselae subsp. piscicida]GAW45934.1 hypothetical protein PDPJ_2_00184 [Photobacterium damselae subsp. piscicida]